MSRRKVGLNNPKKFAFATESTATARHFREYCREKQLSMGGELEEMMIDYLIKVKKIKNRGVLEAEDALGGND